MLVLTRNVGGTIVLGGYITVSVNQVDGNSARLGIRAPSTMSIHRSEIYEKICEQLVGRRYVISGTLHHVESVGEGLVNLIGPNRHRVTMDFDNFLLSGNFKEV